VDADVGEHDRDPVDDLLEAKVVQPRNRATQLEPELARVESQFGSARLKKALGDVPDGDGRGARTLKAETALKP
jgi:hypothetical protein